MPLYAITDKATGRSVLVETDRPASALRIVTDRIYVIITPTPLEAAMLASEGAPILREGVIPPVAEPATDEQFEQAMEDMQDKVAESDREERETDAAELDLDRLREDRDERARLEAEAGVSA